MCLSLAYDAVACCRVAWLGLVCYGDGIPQLVVSWLVVVCLSLAYNAMACYRVAWLGLACLDVAFHSFISWRGVPQAVANTDALGWRQILLFFLWWRLHFLRVYIN